MNGSFKKEMRDREMITFIVWWAIVSDENLSDDFKQKDFRK